MPVGRPSKYTQKLADLIIERVAGGETLTKICESDQMPDRRTVYRWTEANEAFRHAYARAREHQLESWADEILDIASDQSRDIQYDAEGRPRSDNTAVNRDRLRIDTKKWLMAKLNPKRYGDKVTQEHTGEDGGPIKYARVVDRPPKETPEEWQARVSKQLQERAKDRK